MSDLIMITAQKGDDDGDDLTSRLKEHLKVTKKLTSQKENRCKLLSTLNTHWYTSQFFFACNFSMDSFPNSQSAGSDISERCCTEC